MTTPNSNESFSFDHCDQIPEESGRIILPDLDNRVLPMHGSLDGSDLTSPKILTIILAAIVAK
jgi:hypothetical protein